MPEWRKYNSPEAKQARSKKSSRAAQARWDAYHAAKADEPLPFELPPDCYRITVENLILNRSYVLLFHPAGKSGSYNIDMNGVFWKKCGFTEAMVWIRKACRRMKKIPSQ